MTASDPKADLRFYLQSARDALLWKLEGLSEYDVAACFTRPRRFVPVGVRRAADADRGDPHVGVGVRIVVEPGQRFTGRAPEGVALVAQFHRVGMSRGNTALAPGDPAWWEDQRRRLERAAVEAGRREEAS
ncbi:hypothetical protein ACWDQL_04735 [Streptomyces olivaceus]